MYWIFNSFGSPKTFLRSKVSFGRNRGAIWIRFASSIGIGCYRGRYPSIHQPILLWLLKIKRLVRIHPYPKISLKSPDVQGLQTIRIVIINQQGDLACNDSNDTAGCPNLPKGHVANPKQMGNAKVIRITCSLWPWNGPSP